MIEHPLLDIALVSCIGQKRSQSCPAQDMYISPWFRKAKLYVEQRGYDWYILSAKYGLVHRDEVIAPL